MKVAIQVAVATLLLIAVDAHRSLPQGPGRGNESVNDRGGENNGNESVNGRGLASNGENVGPNENKNGRFFRFHQIPGGARAFIRELKANDTGKLQRIRANSGIRKSDEELARQLEEDPDLGLDVEAEALIFACSGLLLPENVLLPSQQPAPMAQAGDASSAVQAAVARPGTAEALVSRPREALAPGPTTVDPATTQAFSLSSRPGVARKIWLDFRGGTVANTAWNRAGASIVQPAYDLDGNAASFSTTELSNIVAIWRAVSEDYAPFNVDVTTVDQAAAGTPPSNYMRVAIGGRASLLGIQAGGVAYVGVYGRTDTYYQPAWVFSQDLGNGYAKYVWEAASHEVGHTMGLSHDGRNLATGSEAYYTGGNGWASIMGAGYYQPVTQWSKGEYVQANNQEDDLQIISSKLSYVASGNGGSPTAATPLVGTVAAGRATSTATGIIARTGAADFFSFRANPGVLTVAVTVVPAWNDVNRSNLNVRITVTNANNQAIGNYNNPSTLEASRTFTLAAAGTLYIAIRGANEGDTATGYSNYGSLGQFSMTVTYPAA